MSDQDPVLKTELPVSEMAESLVGSEIIRLAGNIRKAIAEGANIHNLTIGDFDPAVFPIPEHLKAGIQEAYESGATNYPPANGLPELREAVARVIQQDQGLDYGADDVLIAGGARPLIHAVYTALVDPGERVVYPVPSWNNNHYTHLMRGEGVPMITGSESHFLPTADQLRPHLNGARLLALCSPLNPTGTAFKREQLLEICAAVLEENKRRTPDDKPLFVMFDQIYWQLTYGATEHVDPVTLCPELRPYVVFIDGMSKCYAATGVRVGWAFGPEKIIAKMRAILGHIGAWSPRAEQVATAGFLSDTSATSTYLNAIRSKLQERLDGIYAVFMALKAKGFAVNAIAPQAAIYLTVQFNLTGKRTHAGQVLESTEDITAYLLEQANLGIVPFYAFGAERSSTWYRISVGTLKGGQVDALASDLERALQALS